MSSVETTALQAGDSIELVSPDPLGWASRFDTVRSRLLTLLPKAEIEHIGSTSVPRLPAKDVVDVLVGVDPRQFSAAVNLLAANGFDFEGCREDTPGSARRTEAAGMPSSTWSTGADVNGTRSRAASLS